MPSCAFSAVLPANAGGGVGGGVLDFGGTSDVLFVGKGGVLTLSRIRAQGMAEPNGHRTPIAAFVLWPSIQLAPGSQVNSARRSSAQRHCRMPVACLNDSALLAACCWLGWSFPG